MLVGEQKQDGLARLLDPARRMTCPLLTHRTGAALLE
jgi:hypothetical protein